MAYACVDAKGSVMRNTAETQRCAARVHTAWRGVWRAEPGSARVRGRAVGSRSRSQSSAAGAGGRRA